MGRKGGGVRIKQVGPKKVPKMANPMDALTIPPEEMIHLPPPPDRSYQFFWPMHETFRMDPTKFIVIYPSYLDSTKSIRQGRRISTKLAVPVPTVSDLSQALQQLSIRHVIQPYKGYPRDTTTLWDNPGRVKVDYDGDGDEFGDPTSEEGFDVDNLPEIGDDDGDNNDESPRTKNSKRVLMIELARRIRTLPARIERLKRAEEEAKQLQAEREKEEKAEKERQAAQQRQLQQRQKQQSSTSNKKKGKKKK